MKVSRCAILGLLVRDKKDFGVQIPNSSYLDICPVSTWGVTVLGTHTEPSLGLGPFRSDNVHPAYCGKRGVGMLYYFKVA